jgi:hypothetical protein
MVATYGWHWSLLIEARNYYCRAPPIMTASNVAMRASISPDPEVKALPEGMDRAFRMQVQPGGCANERSLAIIGAKTVA